MCECIRVGKRGPCHKRKLAKLYFRMQKEMFEWYKSAERLPYLFSSFFVILAGALVVNRRKKKYTSDFGSPMPHYPDHLLNHGEASPNAIFR